jgi:hypothetical protein
MALSVLASCSTYHGLFAARPATAAGGPAAATTSSSAPSAVSDQRRALFGFGEGDKKPPQPGATETPEIDCPGVEIRQGASTFQQSGTDTGSSALSLRYGELHPVRARCALRDGNVVMKVGIEGRVIRPAGAPGPVTLPWVRLAVEGRARAEDDLDQVLHGAGGDAARAAERAVHPCRGGHELPNPPGDELDKYVVWSASIRTAPRRKRRSRCRRAAAAEAEAVAETTARAMTIAWRRMVGRVRPR